MVFLDLDALVAGHGDRLIVMIGHVAQAPDINRVARRRTGAHADELPEGSDQKGQRQSHRYPLDPNNAFVGAHPVGQRTGGRFVGPFITRLGFGIGVFHRVDNRRSNAVALSAVPGLMGVTRATSVEGERIRRKPYRQSKPLRLRLRRWRHANVGKLNSP